MSGSAGRHPRSPYRTVPTKRPRHPAPCDVVVIGAGPAGLAAAYELVHAGHRVTVCEASARPGGRVRTLRAPFTDGRHAEAGAAFLPGHHTLTIGYAKLMGLTLVPFGQTDTKPMVFMRQTAIENPSDKDAPWPVPLPPAERIGLLGLWGKYILPTVLRQVGDPRSVRWPSAALRAYDGVSFMDFLTARGASADAIEILRLGYFDVFGEGADAVSALSVLRDLALTVEGVPPQVHPGFSISVELPHLAEHAAGKGVDQGTYQIEGGNDRLATALAASEPLTGRIAWRSPVTRIEPAGARLAVICDRAAGRERLEADHVVCAIPFSLLRRIEIAVPLSDDKRRVIDRLRNTSVTRVYVQTRSRCWERAGRSPFASTDLPGTCVNHHTVTQPGPTGILGAYAGGRAARALAALDEEARARVTVAWLDAMYPGLAGEVVATASVAWDDDPWARGAYCWFAPGEMASLLPALTRPEGRLHFAGDQTSVLPGWIEGAFESALRTVDEVRDAG